MESGKFGPSGIERREHPLRLGLGPDMGAGFYMDARESIEAPSLRRN